MQVMPHQYSQTSATSMPLLLQRDWAFLASFFALVFLILLIDPAYAAPKDSVMGSTLCRIVDMVYGNLGKGLCSLAIIIVGVGATLGKVSWGMAMVVGVGISIVFGAGMVLDQIVPAFATGGICPII